MKLGWCKPFSRSAKTNSNVSSQHILWNLESKLNMEWSLGWFGRVSIWSPQKNWSFFSFKGIQSLTRSHSGLARFFRVTRWCWIGKSTELLWTARVLFFRSLVHRVNGAGIVWGGSGLMAALKVHDYNRHFLYNSPVYHIGYGSKLSTPKWMVFLLDMIIFVGHLVP